MTVVLAWYGAICAAVTALAGAALLGWYLGDRRARRRLARSVVADAEMWCRRSAAFHDTYPAMPETWTTALFLRHVDAHPSTQARPEAM